MDFNIDVKSIIKGLAEFEIKATKALEDAAIKGAGIMENYAKSNANWEDKTGQARATLKGGNEWNGHDKVNVYIAGNMIYSPRLEYDYSGKYAILQPTVNACSKDILKMIKIK